ncbi:MAG: winged helix-turn-helix domain-containing protein [Candidatus Bathyarchaeia archaeon]
MKLKLRIMRGEETIFEIPLSFSDWPREHLMDELESTEEEFQRLSRLFATLSNMTRLMMMKRIMEEEDHTASFTDFMRDLNLNPKLVREYTRRLTECGLLEKVGRGRYRCSRSGETSFIMLSLALRRLMESFNE